MILYSFYGGDNNDVYATKAEAKRAARKVFDDDLDINEIEIERHEVVKITKESLCEILNSSGGSWSASYMTVAIVTRKKGRR